MAAAEEEIGDGNFLVGVRDKTLYNGSRYKERKGDDLMEYTIRNEKLTVVISDRGAELQSIQTADGHEYLWQSDPVIWTDRAPNIFPYVARMTDGKYTLNGKEYKMDIHGFLKDLVLDVEEQSQTAITFRLCSNEQTKAQYPFDFVYRINYKLEQNRLMLTTSVENKGGERMYFGFGGHPGFQVPMEDGLAFEDYTLRFDQKSQPYRVGFDASCFITGQDEVYPLTDGDKIELRHDLFDDDAIVLKHMARKVCLGSEKGTRSVTVSYPDLPILGIWHRPKTEAAYVCIEPWSSLPSRAGIVEELSQQADLIHIAPGKTYSNSWSIEIN